MAYKLITSQTLGSDTATVTFTSIPQTYTDLRLVISARNTSSALGTGVDIAFNSTALSNGFILFGDGVTAYGASNPSSSITGGTNTTGSVFSNGELYIPNYSLTSRKKSAIGHGVIENNSTNAYVVVYGDLWSGVTAAITSITLTVNGGFSFTSASKFYLYGIS